MCPCCQASARIRFFYTSRRVHFLPLPCTLDIALRVGRPEILRHSPDIRAFGWNCFSCPLRNMHRIGIALRGL